MGARGPKPRSRNAKAKRGIDAPSRIIDTPIVSGGPGDPPQHLRRTDPTRREQNWTDSPTRAADVWREVVEAMGGEPWIREADRLLLEQLCEAVVLHRRAYVLIRRSDVLIPGVRTPGEVVKNPANQVWRDTGDTIRLLSVQLGLTPSARAALHLEDATALDGDESSYVTSLPEWKRKRIEEYG